jgi:LytR cell envelope-related transcriptional attenuator
MSTDLPESNEPQRGGTGRPPRVGDSRSPVGSTLSIVLAVIAVVAGFLILRELTDDDGGTSTAVDDPTEETGPQLSGPVVGSTPGEGTTAGGGQVTSTTAAAVVRSGATIAVANASGVGGSAGAMSSAITTEGYEGVGEPGNSTGEQLSATVVYYVATDAAAQAVAQTLATDLGGVSVEPMPAERPVDGNGDTGTATVVVMLGTDAANKSLSELRATTVTAPAVGGNTTASTTG